MSKPNIEMAANTVLIIIDRAIIHGNISPDVNFIASKTILTPTHNKLNVNITNEHINIYSNTFRHNPIEFKLYFIATLYLFLCELPNCRSFIILYRLRV